MKTVALNEQWKARKPKVASVNIYILKKHFKDMKANTTIQKSDVICLQETWINPHHDDTDDLNLQNYSSHFTSIGKGKGIATFYKDTFEFQQEVINPMYQICKISSKEKDIINVYRTKGAPSSFLDV